MLVAYVDDSGGKDTAYITLAGHTTTEANWREFETQARYLFDQIGLEFLHTEDFRHNRGFWKDKDWDYRKGFADTLFKVLNRQVPDSFEFSVPRKRYTDRKKALGKNKTVSPLGFCMIGILNEYHRWGHLDLLVEKDETLSFVVEAGNSNNNDVLARFGQAKKTYPVLGDLTFADKKSAIALQAADFIAYYSRRLRGMNPKAKRYPDELAIFQAVTERLEIRHFGAEDFGV